MATYRLLRNNCEEGPFQLRELIAKGLKPYDLVWVENRSAAWRYPSELEELKPFAPVVEEQPFDRFFSKKVVDEIKNHSLPSSEASLVSAACSNNSLAQNLHISVILPPGTTKQEQISEPKKEQSFISQTAAFASNANSNEPLNDGSKDKLKQQIDTTVRKYHQYSTASKQLSGWKMLLAMAGILGAGFAIGIWVNKPDVIAGVSPSNVAGVTDKPAQLNTQVQQVLPENETNMPAAENQALNQQSLSTPMEDAPAKPQKKLLPSKQKPAPVTNEGKGNPGKQEAAGNAQVAAETVKAIAAKPVFRGSYRELVAVTNNEYKIGAFGGINNLQVTVNNLSQYTLDEVLVEVQYLLPNDKVFKTERLQFHQLQPGLAMMKEAPKSPRGVKIATRLVMLNSSQVEIAQ